MYFLIVTNSPGELTGWVQPMARALKRACPQCSVMLVIPPCQFASGKELDIAAQFPEVEATVGPKQYVRFLFSGRKRGLSRSLKGERGLCIFLGGDPFHAVLVARRMRIPLVGYLRTPRWRRQFKRYMVRSKEEKNLFIGRGVEAGRVCVVGDLMIDAFCPSPGEDMQACQMTQKSSGSFHVVLLPGSRPQIARNMIPFFLGVCEFLLHEFPEVEFSLLFSSFLGENILEEIAGAELYRAMKVPAVRVMLTAEGLALISEGGVRANVLQEGHRKAMYSADLALTIPGTNTMELACTGTPMVVVLPLHRPEMIPLDGLAGLVGSIPIVGRMIKSVGVNRYLKRWRYCALPNMRAGRELVPEVKGNIAPEDVARVAISLLKDRKRRAVISTDLREVTGENGATDRFACCCLELLEQSCESGLP